MPGMPQALLDISLWKMHLLPEAPGSPVQQPLHSLQGPPSSVPQRPPFDAHCTPSPTHPADGSQQPLHGDPLHVPIPWHAAEAAGSQLPEGSQQPPGHDAELHTTHAPWKQTGVVALQTWHVLPAVPHAVEVLPA